MLLLNAVAWTLPHRNCHQNAHIVWNVVKNAALSQWFCKKLVLEVKGHTMRIPSSAMVHRGEKRIDHVTARSKVQIKARTQVSLHLRQQGLCDLQFSKHYITYRLTPSKEIYQIQPFVNFIFIPLRRQWFRLTNPLIFLFFLFMCVLFVAVHLSEWNTEAKLGQYSLQLRQRQLSFKSPPHPHFPGMCHWKPSLRARQRLHSLLPPAYTQLSLASEQR